MEAKMNQFSLAKQMINFNRTTFESTLGAMCLLQEQSEKMMTTFVEQANWIPGEGKKAISDMAAMFKKGCSEFKKAVDESFDKMEAYFEQANAAK
jgi:polyhydroxyalkanoate synthesis regulator phasin